MSTDALKSLMKAVDTDSSGQVMQPSLVSSVVAILTIATAARLILMNSGRCCPKTPLPARASYSKTWHS